MSFPNILKPIARSLPRKIILTMFVSILIAEVVCLSSVGFMSSRNFTKSGEQRALDIIHTYESSLTSDIPASQIQAFIDHLAAKNTDIMEFNVYSLGNHPVVIASNHKDQVGQSAQPEDIAAAKQNKTVLLENGNIIDITTPLHIHNQIAYVVGIKFSLASANSTLNHTLMMSNLIGVVVLIVISTLLYFLFRREITTPIIKIIDTAEKIASGDLTEEDDKLIRRSDELGQLNHKFTLMRKQLRGIIGNLQHSSGEVQGHVHELTKHADSTAKETMQIASGVQQISLSGQMLTKSTEETSLALDEIAAGVQKIADSSGIVSEASTDSAEEAAKGQTLLKNTAWQMDRVNERVQGMETVIESLTDHSSEIASIIQIITEIASQTSLLSLNAAIEAARAGESGRGFAVVASEIRKLSDDTTESAKQISELITRIMQFVRESNDSMSAVSGEVVKGIHSVTEASLAFEKIMQKVQDVSAQIQEVSAAAEQMSAGTEEVTADMDETARSVKKSSEYTANISHNTEIQMENMKKINQVGVALAHSVSGLESVVKRFTL